MFWNIDCEFNKMDDEKLNNNMRCFEIVIKDMMREQAAVKQ